MENSPDVSRTHLNVTVSNQIPVQCVDPSFRLDLFAPYPPLPIHMPSSAPSPIYWYPGPRIASTNASSTPQGEINHWELTSGPPCDGGDDFQPRAVLNMSVSPRECPFTTSGAWEDDTSFSDQTPLHHPGDEVASLVLSDLAITPISPPSPTIDVASLESLDAPGEPLTFLI